MGRARRNTRALRQSARMSPDYSWSFNPGAILAVAIVGAVYLSRWRAVRRTEGSRGAPTIRLVSFMAGLVVVLIAVVSPVDRLAEQLFSMHMVQHMLLLDVAPILCLLGLTKVLLRPATKRLHYVERRAGPFGHPLFAAFLYGTTMWVWHIPALYDAALEYPVVHVLEHLAFTLVGGLYWWHLLSPVRSRQRMGGLGPLAYMGTTKLSLGILGIALTFAPTVFYGFYENQPEYWGLSHLADQQVGGMIMALEQAVVMGAAFCLLFIRMLSESEREEQRRERYEDAAEAL
jgi:putative membrane protein